MKWKDFKNLKIGDRVILNMPLKDQYGEKWHEIGETVVIEDFTDDGKGVIFEWSKLGTSWRNIEILDSTKMEKV